MSPGRVVIADDDVLLREGVATLLERSGFDIWGAPAMASSWCPRSVR
jgi:DNA-binding NarL/FixJ family response regulator